MAPRWTRVVLSIPWDDEEQSHPVSWAYDTLLGVPLDGREVILIDFSDQDDIEVMDEPV